jgi:hypothetical protein
MAVRLSSDKDIRTKIGERLDKFVGRIYLLWLLGVFVGVLKLKPEKVSINSIEFTISNADALQGLIFVGCICFYLAIFGTVFIFSLQYSGFTSDVKRRAIHAGLGTRRTFRNLNSRQLLVAKKAAHVLLRFIYFIGLLIFFFPLLHILIFERTPLWAALKVLFGGT